ncbi:MAG: hypothetical protein ABSD49_14540 [Candidatus Bathyarchaeia archaeon]
MRKTQPNKGPPQATGTIIVTVFTDLNRVPLRFMAFRALNLVHAYPSKMP